MAEVYRLLDFGRSCASPYFKLGHYPIGGDPAAIAEAEVERFTLQLEKLGLPRPGAVRAAREIVRARLREMKRCITDEPVNGERGPQTLSHANRTSFMRVYRPQEILDLLTEPMFPGELKKKCMAALGISRSSFHRLLAQLRDEGKVRYLPGSYVVERVEDAQPELAITDSSPASS
jgi:hypothetical protein